MFSSLRSRLWLSYAFLIVTALSVVAIVMFIYLLRNPILNRQTIERLKAVETMVANRGSELERQPLPAAIERAASTFNVRIILYSIEKQVLVDTRGDTASGLPYPEKRILSRATPLARDENGKAWLYTISQLQDGTWLMVAAPRPRFSIINIFTDDLLPLFLQGGLIALLLSLVIALFFAKWIADPLQKVIFAARAMPSVEAKPVEVHGPHEVQDLTRAFNSMIRRVQSSQQSQRDFVANVSHELKTPLTSIQGFAQAILDGTAESPESRKQAAEVIFNESARMHRMVLDLLDLARLDAGTANLKMTPMDVTALFNAMAEKFSPQLQEAGVTMTVNIPNHLPSLIGDGDRLAQVFTNLVDNALKFTPRGGVINLSASASNGEMLLSVSDTGPGIPPEALPHIFDRFYRADPAREGGGKHGAGLGLAIVQQIVQAHSGRITVRSGIAGTTFDVFLPLSQAAATTIVRRR
jgi:signal transduction histidine kinase